MPAKTSLWSAIASSLRSAIAEGQYAMGARLPTEAQLADRFGVNRHTVRHAISALAKEGLVHSRRGSGVYVLARPVDYPLGARMRFHQSLSAAGRMPEKRVLLVEVRAATGPEAARLEMDEGQQICVYHALSFVDGIPVAIAESQFPEARLPGIARALEQGPSVTGCLATVGVTDYTRASTRLSARIATAQQAAHLRLAEGAPLLFATSVNIDQDQRPVEFGKTWFASERITLTLDAPSG